MPDLESSRAAAIVSELTGVRSPKGREGDRQQRSV